MIFFRTLLERKRYGQRTNELNRQRWERFIRDHNLSVQMNHKKKNTNNKLNIVNNNKFNENYSNLSDKIDFVTINLFLSSIFQLIKSVSRFISRK